MSTTTDEGQRVAMYRVGHRVPCHVYRAGVPLFTAATDDLARTVVSDANAGIGAIESTAALVQEVERLRAVCAERQSRIDAIEKDSKQLRAYLRAFVRATYEPGGAGRQPGAEQKMIGVHRVNPSMLWAFRMVDDGCREDRAITGGQVLRAMELLGEVPELTPAEEAKNLVAVAVLRNVQWYVADAAKRVAAMPEDDRRKHDLLGVSVHLQNTVQAIGAAAPGYPTPIDVQIADALQEVRTFVEAMNATDMAPTDTYMVCLSFMDEQTASEALTAGTLRAIVRLADLIVPPSAPAPTLPEQQAPPVPISLAIYDAAERVPSLTRRALPEGPLTIQSAADFIRLLTGEASDGRAGEANWAARAGETLGGPRPQKCRAQLKRAGVPDDSKVCAVCHLSLCRGDHVCPWDKPENEGARV